MASDFEEQADGTSALRPGAIAAGTVLLVLGGTMLLDTTGAIDVPAGRLFGPAVMIALGALMLLDMGGLVCGYRSPGAEPGRPRHRRRGGRTGGVWLIGVGVWMLVAQVHLFGLDFHNSWPLFVILSGIIMLTKGLR